MSFLGPAFQSRNFRRFFWGRLLIIMSHQMLAVTVGQAAYELTHDPLVLGLIGLAVFLPRFVLTLPAGHLADHHDRRTIIVVSRVTQIIAAIGFLGLALLHFQPLWMLFVLLVFTATATAFDAPAAVALVPELVPESHFDNAVAWGSFAMQAATISGPLVAGALYAWSGGAWWPLVAVLATRVVSAWCMVALRTSRVVRTTEQPWSWREVLAGLRYVWAEPVILGIISLDLFAVLFGGAVALLPIYANEILHVGPDGLGMLRAAPAAGAAVMAMLVARYARFPRPGRVLLVAVACFGLATIVFGISRDFLLSLTALAALGAADSISVVIRGILVQTRTPPALRGRVSAVSLVFIGASNELGEFESGVTARWFGTIPAVVIGGCATLAIVALWTWRFPALRRLRREDGVSSIRMETA